MTRRIKGRKMLHEKGHVCWVKWGSYIHFIKSKLFQKYEYLNDTHQCQPNWPSWPLKQLCQCCLKISFRVYWDRPNPLTSLLPSRSSLSQLYNTSHRAKLHTDTSRWLLLFPTHNLPTPHRAIGFFHPPLSHQHTHTHRFAQLSLLQDCRQINPISNPNHQNWCCCLLHYDPSANSGFTPEKVDNR